MRYMRYPLFALIVLVALFGCASGEGVNNLAELQTYEGLSAALDKGRDIALYDVRTTEEYTAGHIPKAVHIPYDMIGELIPVEDKSAVIVVYCQSGSRAGQAKETLEGLGYKNVVNFGGIGKWEGKLITGSSPE